MKSSIFYSTNIIYMQYIVSVLFLVMAPFSDIFFIFSQHVLDLSWSHKAGENWLLSASMDKSVRLWHLTKENSLLEFTHSETVKCVAFHPEENSLFVSGSLDGKIRVWNVPEQRTICSESVC